ncbi:hypothetical protein BD779DRAFT_1458573, partial [Infundibulicybe gibba]
MVYTSPTKKARIVALKAEGLTDRNIASCFSVHPTTVARIVKKYGTGTSFYHTAHKPGRPAKITDNDVRFAIRLLGACKAVDATDLQCQYFPHVTPQTIRARLRKAGYMAYKRRVKPLLTAAH